MILRSTAYNFFNEFNADDGIVLPGSSLKKKAIRGIAKKISLENTFFLVTYFDEHPSPTLEMTREALIGHFEGLIISFPALWKHSTEQCSFSLKQASEYNAGRDSEITPCIRQKLVSKWKKIDVDLQKKKSEKKSVFIDGAGFNTQMLRGRAWSRVGEPAKFKVHS